MHWTIFGGVDGTGDADQRVYESTFEKSFVRELKSKIGGQFSSYSRGPTLWDQGVRSLDLATSTWQHVRLCVGLARKNGINYSVFLAGFSRGGAAVIHAARLLKEDGIPIKGLFLYDAVDRSFSVKSVKSIPGNVLNCYHAMRSPKAGSREIFDNCGLTVENPLVTKFVKNDTFVCTHGAMGGTPWVMEGDANLDQNISEAIWFMRAPTNVTGFDELRETKRVRLWMLVACESCRVV